MAGVQDNFSSQIPARLAGGDKKGGEKGQKYGTVRRRTAPLTGLDDEKCHMAHWEQKETNRERRPRTRLDQ